MLHELTERHRRRTRGFTPPACDALDAFVAARRVAEAHGGWMLREQGGPPDDDGFGVPLPNIDVMRRIKQAFDPENKCNPGRLPL